MTTEAGNAYRWWANLSINEQEAHRLKHQYFKNFDKAYFASHKTAIVQMHETYFSEADHV